MVSWEKTRGKEMRLLLYLLVIKLLLTTINTEDLIVKAKELAKANGLEVGSATDEGLQVLV